MVLQSQGSILSSSLSAEQEEKKRKKKRKKEKKEKKEKERNAIWVRDKRAYRKATFYEAPLHDWESLKAALDVSSYKQMGILGFYCYTLS